MLVHLTEMQFSSWVHLLLLLGPTSGQHMEENMSISLRIGLCISVFKQCHVARKDRQFDAGTDDPTSWTNANSRIV
jgi:hypothetical protein